MKTDKNTIIGFVLLALLFFAFFWYTNKQQQTVLAEQKKREDSLARVKGTNIKPVDTATARLDSSRLDSVNRVATAGNFATAATGTEQEMVVENEVMKAIFSNKGGMLKSVELKKYSNSYTNKPVVLGGTVNDKLAYSINTASNQSTLTSSLFFTGAPVIKNADGSQTINFTLAANGQSITHSYLVRAGDYMIDWNIGLQGADQLLSQNILNLQWSLLVKQQQKDIKYERQQSRLAYVEDAKYDFSYAATGASHTIEKPSQWVTFKQQFFNATLIAKNNFSSGQLQLTPEGDSTHILFDGTASLRVQMPAAAVSSASFQIYYGPTDYRVLNQYGNKMENIVDLGSGIFSFVKYINRFIIMPVFHFFAKIVSNYGWVILLLTLCIRLVTGPLTYTSYLSGAKMKVLRPELDTLKKKFGEDQQGFAMEQMKLFREAGVNPLGGCIPALLQIPIFFALYSFFNSNIDLRGQSFLWSHDLSQYDTIATLPFSIPFGYGDHVSLFTLMAVITSFLISIYNMSMTPDQSNPVMKYMPYI
ncbi:MAG: yidC, partial [Chitinophagaceae bacterium]|nr:yidC [Chitinophagaceae bacterium]